MRSISFVYILIGSMPQIKGPAIFLAQFMGDEPPYNNLSNITKWVKDLGYKAVQLPSWDGRIMDLKKAAESKSYCDDLKAQTNGLEITELASHLQGQLVASHPAYDELFNGFAAKEVQGDPLWWATLYSWPQLKHRLVQNTSRGLSPKWGLLQRADVSLRKWWNQLSSNPGLELCCCAGSPLPPSHLFFSQRNTTEDERPTIRQQGGSALPDEPKTHHDWTHLKETASFISSTLEEIKVMRRERGAVETFVYVLLAVGVALFVLWSSKSFYVRLLVIVILGLLALAYLFFGPPPGHKRKLWYRAKESIYECLRLYQSPSEKLAAFALALYHPLGIFLPERLVDHGTS